MTPEQIAGIAGKLTKPQREARLHRMALAMAKTHDRVVRPESAGAELALRAGNGPATYYWREIAKAAVRAYLEKEPRL